jgi:hypothetical protein
MMMSPSTASSSFEAHKATTLPAGLGQTAEPVTTLAEPETKECSAVTASPGRLAGQSQMSAVPQKAIAVSPLPHVPNLPSVDAADDTRLAQDALRTAMVDVSISLGAGHAEVEAAKKQLQKFRIWDENIRWREVVTWHEHNIAAALVAVEDGTEEISRLEQAVKAAHDSELGPGHPLVLVGKDCVTQLRKRAEVNRLQDSEERHANLLQNAMDSGDQEELLKAIRTCAEALGSAHPVVEAARLVHKQRRSALQKSDWDERVQTHGDLLRSASNTRSRPMMEAAIQGAISAGLGIGHPLILEAKKDLTLIMKQDQREKWRTEQATCEHRLRALAHEVERSLVRRQQQVEDARSHALQLLPGGCN